MHEIVLGLFCQPSPWIGGWRHSSQSYSKWIRGNRNLFIPIVIRYSEKQKILLNELWYLLMWNLVSKSWIINCFVIQSVNSLFRFWSSDNFWLFLFSFFQLQVLKGRSLFVWREMRPIFCGNFEYDARQSDLERLFRRYGKVDRVDMKSGKSPFYIDHGSSFIQVNFCSKEENMNSYGVYWKFLVFSLQTR